MQTPTPAAEGRQDAQDTTPRARIDYSRLTLGEVDKIETLSGLPVSALEDETSPKGRLLAALVFIASRRYGEPKSWDECLAMEVTAASDYLGIADEDEDDDEAQAATDDEVDDEGKD